MRTLVLSDLHLGAHTQVDVLRRPELRAPLLERLHDVDRVVLLGDALELRHAPVGRAIAAAEGFFRDLGSAVAEVVYLTGNHDWALLRPWLESRSEPLGLAESTGPEGAGPLAGQIAAWLAPARVTFAYPGIWLREDVYATHGHYCDLFSTVPTVERLAATAMARWVSRPGGAPHTPADYEAALAPLYAWIHEVSQNTGRGGANVTAASAGASTGVWQRLRRDPRRDPVAALTWATVGLGVLGLRRIGLGPLSLDLSPAGLRRGSLRGIGRAMDSLGVEAEHVIWGHSHRSGPWPADDLQEWRTPGGARIVNVGSWIYAKAFLTGAPNESPYWPGVVAIVDDAGPPRLERLLGYRGHADLRPPREAPGLTGVPISSPAPASRPL